MHVKKMPMSQFMAVMRRNWVPVELCGEAVPDWARNIPSEISHSIMASGTIFGGAPYSSEQIPSGELIGGIDVYRKSPDDPVELNKDWYAVVVVPGTDGMLLVDGPFKDAEHWLNELPQRLKGVGIWGVPKKLPGS